MTPVEVVFEDPPPRKYGRAPVVSEQLRAALIARPGEWARISSMVSAGYGSIVKKSLGAGFEVTSREADKDKQGRRRTHVWARYIGGES